MQIRRGLPLFEDKTVLIIATGTREGVFYLAQGGKIDKLKEYRVPSPKYSDKEGFSIHGGKGGVTGSARELNRRTLDAEFIKETVSQVKQGLGRKSVDEVFILTPSELKYALPKALPYDLRKRVKLVIVGNHHEKHPFEILKLIA